MESRWMRRKTENGSEEKFYPITHKDAVVNLNETLLEKANKNDVVTTEVAEEEITGDAPELSPIAAQRIAELEARIAELENSGGTGGSGGGAIVLHSVYENGAQYLCTVEGDSGSKITKEDLRNIMQNTFYIMCDGGHLLPFCIYAEEYDDYGSVSAVDIWEDGPKYYYTSEYVPEPN